MPSVTELRGFAKRLSVADVAIWMLDERLRVIFASDALGPIVGCPSDDLWGRSAGADDLGAESRAGESQAPGLRDALDRLRPPPGLHQAGVIVRAAADDDRHVTFVSLGDPVAPWTLGIIGTAGFPPLRPGPECGGLFETLELQRLLDTWRNDDRHFHDAVVAGNSSAARRLRRQIDVAARLREDTLILAPDGFPAETIARRLHASADPAEPLDVIDGSLMDLELLEAVGAPLVAHLTDRQTSTATAIIAKLDQTPDDAQGRLAQWKEVFGNRLRLIALANGEDFTGAAANELMESLCGLVIRVPPLAGRGDDVPLIATAMLESGKRKSSDAERLSREALDALVRYPWPGDVGELEQSIRHAANVCTGTAIGKEHLPLAVRSFRPGRVPGGEATTIDLDATLAAIERRLIEDAVRSSDGNRAEAARRLGISRARLLRRLDDTGEDAAAR